MNLFSVDTTTAIDIPTVAHVIQLSLTPVFLLGTVSAMINFLLVRLSRITDKAAALKDLASPVSDDFDQLARRAHLIRISIVLCAVCAILVGASIVSLFISAELAVNLARPTAILFILAIIALVTGLCCFVREITLHWQALKKGDSLI